MKQFDVAIAEGHVVAANSRSEQLAALTVCYEGNRFRSGPERSDRIPLAEGHNEQPPTSGPHPDKPHRASLRRRGEVRPFFHLHSGDELVATVLGAED